jgi:hypothetical protein
MPKPLTIWSMISSEAFLSLVKDEFAFALREIMVHAGELAQNDGRTAAIDYLRKSKISPEPFDELLHDGPALLPRS